MIIIQPSLRTAQIIVELVRNDIRTKKLQDLVVECYINKECALEQGFCISKAKTIFTLIDEDNPIRLQICEDKSSDSIVIYKTVYNSSLQSEDNSIHYFGRDFNKVVDFIFKSLGKYLLLSKGEEK